MRHDDGIPIAGRDAGEQLLAVFLFKVLLGGGQNVGAGVELHEVFRPLPDQMVRHDQHGLLGEPHPAHFHDAGDHRERLASADDVIQQGRARLDHAPHGIGLVRPQRDDVVADFAGERQVRAVVLTADVGVERVVVDA